MSAAQHHLRSQSLAVLRASNALHASLLPNSPPSPTLSTFLTSNTANPSAFSAVIAGEFNAGKSTFINALLGAEILKSGPLPTTDALCLISTPPDITGQDEVDYSEPTFTSRTSDGNVDVSACPQVSQRCQLQRRQALSLRRDVRSRVPALLRCASNIKRRDFLLCRTLTLYDMLPRYNTTPSRTCTGPLTPSFRP